MPSGVWVQVPPSAQCDIARHRNTLNPRFQGIFLFLALVIACCVEGEVSLEVACLLVDDSDLCATGEHDCV